MPTDILNRMSFVNLRWRHASEQARSQFEAFFQKSRTAIGVYPDDVWILDIEDSPPLIAMHYSEEGKFNRWGIFRENREDLLYTWSEMQTILRALVGHELHLCEMYPSTICTVDSAPTRWFWVLPSHTYPFEMDLRLK